MKNVMTNVWIHFLMIGSLALSPMAFAKARQPGTGPDSMRAVVNEMVRQIEEVYAPQEWKSQAFGWDLEQTKSELMAKIDAGLTVPQFHKEVANFLSHLRDYHVGVYFASTKASTLPFDIQYQEGGFYVSAIDRKWLPKTRFPFEVGDEIVSFNSKPLTQIMGELMRGKSENRRDTDLALFSMELTNRSGMNGLDVEAGPVLIKGKNQAGQEISSQIMWNTAKEEMTYPGQPGVKRETNDKMAQLKKFLERDYSLPFYSLNKGRRAPRVAGGLGDREGLLPQLGDNLVWKSDDKGEFYSYIYKEETGRHVGVVRIASYVAKTRMYDFVAAIKDFAIVIQAMNEKADILVIDQTNNPGGAVFYLYALASFFSNKPIITPKERMTLDAYTVFDAHMSLEYINLLVQFGLDLGGDIQGYPMDMQFLLFMRDYFNFIIDQWNQGKTLTDPYHLYGVDQIAPRGDVRFTKPVLLLTNRLDFSGGDFFPAIMQDNKLAVLMGENTAGAGGYVLSNGAPNQLGVLGYSLTGSIAIRPNGNPIENLGVTPDVSYVIGKADLQQAYQPFAQAVKAQVKVMLGQ